jgi:hypothetical protein
MPLIVGKHHGNAIGKRLILQGDSGALPALARPGRTDAGPDFLATLVFPCGLAVVDEVSGGVWHRNTIRDTAFSVGDWQGVSTCGTEAESDVV